MSFSLHLGLRTVQYSAPHINLPLSNSDKRQTVPFLANCVARVL